MPALAFDRADFPGADNGNLCSVVLPIFGCTKLCWLKTCQDLQKSFLGLGPWAGWRRRWRFGSKGRRAVRSDLLKGTGCPAPASAETQISSSPSLLAQTRSKLHWELQLILWTKTRAGCLTAYHGCSSCCLFWSTLQLFLDVQISFFVFMFEKGHSSLL